MITTVPPLRTVSDTLASGAEWYSGAGERYRMPSLHCHNPFRKWNSGIGCDGGFSGSGRRMPLGRPVVPDEYSIGVPRYSSAMGEDGNGRVAASRSWNG